MLKNKNTIEKGEKPHFFFTMLAPIVGNRHWSPKFVTENLS